MQNYWKIQMVYAIIYLLVRHTVKVETGMSVYRMKTIRLRQYGQIYTERDGHHEIYYFRKEHRSDRRTQISS